MNRLNIGLIGYGVVGSGVVKFLRSRENFLRNKFNSEFELKIVCDRSIHKKNTRGLGKTILTTKFQDVISRGDIDVVVELIGGIHPAKEIVIGALRSGKHVITANKALLAEHGEELFRIAKAKDRNIYFESSVGAGIPIIKLITEGVAGNKFNGFYGIINGTCNYILTEMTKKHCTFSQALKEAQRLGYAESNPSLDVSGMDSAYKLAILVFLALGKSIKISDMHVEGISHISHIDIDYAESLGLTIKLLSIAKKVKNEIEVRVQPTLIPKDHPLASVNGIFNAIFLDTDPLGDILLYGQGAGQMTAASGVISDLINLAARHDVFTAMTVGNLFQDIASFKLRKIEKIYSKYYLRFMAVDKPGVLATISGILGKHGIGIESVTQKSQTGSSVVPVIILTDSAQEKMLRLALAKIYNLSVVKSKPVAIRREKL